MWLRLQTEFTSNIANLVQINARSAFAPKAEKYVKRSKEFLFPNRYYGIPVENATSPKAGKGHSGR